MIFDKSYTFLSIFLNVIIPWNNALSMDEEKIFNTYERMMRQDGVPKCGYNHLLRAIDKRITDLNIIKHLVEHHNNQRCNVHTETENVGYTPLQWIVQYADLNQVKYLIRHGARVDKKTKKGETLVHLAAAAGRTDVVEYLVNEIGLDVNARNNEGNTPLFEAVLNGELNVFHYLLEKTNADLKLTYSRDVTCLHEAARRGYINEVKMLVHWGSDVNQKDLDGRTPLYAAADGTESGGGHLDIVKYFIEQKKANPFQRDIYGNTLLHAAQWFGTLDVVQYLVEKQGLDVNARNYEGYTSLAEAIQRGKVEITKYLKSQNAHV